MSNSKCLRYENNIYKTFFSCISKVIDGHEKCPAPTKTFPDLCENHLEEIIGVKERIFELPPQQYKWTQNNSALKAHRGYTLIASNPNKKCPDRIVFYKNDTIIPFSEYLALYFQNENENQSPKKDHKEYFKKKNRLNRLKQIVFVLKECLKNEPKAEIRKIIENAIKQQSEKLKLFEEKNSKDLASPEPIILSKPLYRFLNKLRTINGQCVQSEKIFNKRSISFVSDQIRREQLYKKRGYQLFLELFMIRDVNFPQIQEKSVKLEERDIYQAIYFDEQNIFSTRSTAHTILSDYLLRPLLNQVYEDSNVSSYSVVFSPLIGARMLSVLMNIDIPISLEEENPINSNEDFFKQNFPVNYNWALRFYNQCRQTASFVIEYLRGLTSYSKIPTEVQDYVYEFSDLFPSEDESLNLTNQNITSSVHPEPRIHSFSETEGNVILDYNRGLVALRDILDGEELSLSVSRGMTEESFREGKYCVTDKKKYDVCTQFQSSSFPSKNTGVETLYLKI